MKFTIGALTTLILAVSAIPTPNEAAALAGRAPHEIHQHHHHHLHHNADSTEMATSEMKDMKREEANEGNAVKGTRLGPDVNGKFWCMSPHGLVDWCMPE